MIPLRSNGNQALKSGLHVSRKDRKRMFAIMFFELSRYGSAAISLQWQEVLIFHKKYLQSIS